MDSSPVCKPSPAARCVDCSVVVALFLAGAPAAAVVLALLVAMSTALLFRLDRWEA